MTRWAAPAASGPVTGSVNVPGSKSASARSFVLAALADGPSVLSGILDARDTHLMRAGVEALGVRVEDVAPGVVRVTPPEQFSPGRVDVGLSGTVMRFLPAVAALAMGRSEFFGDAEASVRPVAPLLDALRQAGVAIERDALPFAVDGTGRVRGGAVTLDASGSSQFLSALLIAAPRFDEGLTLTHAGPPIPSRPYVDMTVGMLAERGVGIDTDPEGDRWSIHPGPIAARDEAIEPDLINAAVFLCAGLVTGGTVTVPWPRHTLQAADGILGALERFGATVTRADGSVSVSGAICAADVDLSAVSELTCVLASVACLADGPSVLRGVGHIRGHETDRLAALATELTGLGASVTETADGLAIVPGRLHAGQFRTYADHRMAHAAAVLGLAVPGVELDDVGCTTKTMPDFPGLWTALVGA